MRKFLALFLVAFAPAALAQKDAAARGRNQPVEPFRIVGNIYYVGASDITSFLITTPKGHILIDGGFEETAPIIEANIRRLGFKIGDVKILLEDHAHYDHAGGLQELKRVTHAKLFASAGDAPILARGGKDDPQFGDSLTMPSVEVDHLLRDGEPITLGGTTLVTHLTPGHTAGATTWTMRTAGLDVVFATSLSSPDPFRLVNNEKYPDVASDYRRTFATMRTLPCDVFLSSHGSAFHLQEKSEKLRRGAKPNPFIDAQGYRLYISSNEDAFNRKLKEQSAARASNP